MAPPKKGGSAKKASRSALSPEHKAALAVGRDQGRTVRRYLEALDRNRPKRGRKRTLDSVKKQLIQVENKLDGADPLTRLHLMQERRDLEAELADKDSSEDLGELQGEFEVVAAEYGRRKGISYAAWREAGVSPAVLKRAGVSRSARS